MPIFLLFWKFNFSDVSSHLFYDILNKISGTCFRMRDDKIYLIIVIDSSMSYGRVWSDVVCSISERINHDRIIALNQIVATRIDFVNSICYSCFDFFDNFCIRSIYRIQVWYYLLHEKIIDVSFMKAKFSILKTSVWSAFENLSELFHKYRELTCFCFTKIYDIHL